MDTNQREKWREAICLEFHQMTKNNIWDMERSYQLPTQQKRIGSKWVFTVKRNGVYQARLVAKGYDQIPGVEFNYTFAPVTWDISMRVLLVMWFVKGFHAESLMFKQRSYMEI